MAKALDEPIEAIEARARILATEALENYAPWMDGFGVCPAGPLAQVWLNTASTVAACRQRRGATTHSPLEPTRSRSRG